MSMYRIHLPDAQYDRLEQQRATDDGMLLSDETTSQDALVSLETAYSQGRKQTYGAMNGRPRNPYPSSEPRLREAWENGAGDELESFA